VKYGFIDKTGEMVIEPQFDWAFQFSEGLAVVMVGDEIPGKWGYIDRTGEFVIGPEFDPAFIFSEGLAAVRIGSLETGRYGFIDKIGQMVIEPQFDIVYPFANGLARVEVDDEFGYIDKTGNYVWGLMPIPGISEEEGVVAGFIYHNNRPMPNWTVQLIDENGTVIASAKTTQHGHYMIFNIPPGEYTLIVLTFSGAPFPDYEGHIKVRPGRTEVFDIDLHR
jgi:hypothetical protein